MTSACWECPVIRVITWFSPSSWLADRLNSDSTRCYSVKVSLSHYLAESWIEFECMNVSDRSCCISVISHYSSDWYSITFRSIITIYIKRSGMLEVRWRVYKIIQVTCLQHKGSNVFCTVRSKRLLKSVTVIRFFEFI